MKGGRSSVVFASVAMLLVAIGLASCATKQGTRNSEPLPDAGKRQFRLSCAACHGETAQGNGPVAPLLNVAVPDLTRIAARRQGVFPELEIFRIIDGQADLPGHGARHMPVWGYEFFGDDSDDESAHAQATAKVDRLVAYLRSIQRVE